MDVQGTVTLAGFGGPAWRLFTLGFGIEAVAPATDSARSIVLVGFGGPRGRLVTLGFGLPSVVSPSFSGGYVLADTFTGSARFTGGKVIG